jgi:K+-sensing histidine kinase KdpD
MTEEIMICPKCRLEYRQGFEVCAHCQIPLIQKPEDNVQESPDAFAHKKRINWLAITSLFLGILDVVVFIAFFNNMRVGIFITLTLIIAALGFVLGVISFSQKGYGKAISMAGMFLGLLEFNLMFLLFAWPS